MIEFINSLTILTDIFKRKKKRKELINYKSDVIKIGDIIEYDITNNVITFNKPVTIQSKESIVIKSDKHILINSGRTADPYNPGSKYSVWINSETDEDGHPFRYEQFIDKNGYIVLIKAEYTEEGLMKIPEGYKHISEIDEGICEDHNHIEKDSYK
jgi:hypothetical protein